MTKSVIVDNMKHRILDLFTIAVVFAAFLAGSGCSSVPSSISTATSSPTPGASAPGSNAPQAGKNFTAADIAKLKWIEGTYRGTGETQPAFFERYSFDGTTMVVESFEDQTLAKITDTSRFELKDGEFGHTQGDRRSAASEITATYVQFVPVKGGGNSFRFERQDGGSWRAVLDSPAKGDKPAKQVIYKMEPYKK